MEHKILQSLTESKPQLRNEFDAVVAVLHLTMRELGFRCTGLTEKSQSNNNNAYDDKALPDGWNESHDSYSFQYKHTQSSLNFLVKCLVMNDKLLIHGASKEDNKVFSLEISVKDYVNTNSLSNYDGLYKQLDKLTALFKINITSKLLPDLNKAGYENAATETPSTNTSTTRDPPPRRPVDDRPDRPFDPFWRPPENDPLRVPGTGNRPGHFPGFGVGYGDLHPPFPGMGVPPGARGNLVGPDHPSFGPRFGDPYGGGPGLPGAFPPRGFVPGARFDPVGPFPPRNPMGPPGNNGFGDELPPPGFNDNMYL